MDRGQRTYLVPSFQGKSHEIAGESNLELEASFVGQLLDQVSGDAVPNQGRLMSEEAIYLGW